MKKKVVLGLALAGISACALNTAVKPNYDETIAYLKDSKAQEVSVLNNANVYSNNVNLLQITNVFATTEHGAIINQGMIGEEVCADLYSDGWVHIYAKEGTNGILDNIETESNILWECEGKMVSVIFNHREFDIGIGYNEKIKSVTIDSDVKLINLEYLFAGWPNLTEVNVSDWNTSAVVSMEGIFSYCSSLEELDISNWDTSKIKNMCYAFACCSSLKKIDVSSLDTYNTLELYDIFFNCNKLEEIKLGKKLNKISQYTDLKPDSQYIPGATGKWITRNADGTVKATYDDFSEFPDNVEDTYYAEKENEVIINVVHKSKTGKELGKDITIGIVGKNVTIETKEFTGYNKPENVSVETKENQTVTITYEPIEYVLDGGETENPTTYIIEDKIILGDAAKEGYTFVEWQDEEGEKVETIEEGTTGDIKLTAIWEENEVIVEEEKPVETGDISLFGTLATFFGSMTGALVVNKRRKDRK